MKKDDLRYETKVDRTQISHIEAAQLLLVYGLFVCALRNYRGETSTMFRTNPDMLKI